MPVIERSILVEAPEWRFAAKGEKTRVTFVAGYSWPVPIPGRTVGKMLEAELAAMTESSLRELKRLVEARRRRRTLQPPAQ
ncbi:MAG: SRPBCC family protein [Chloroflexota bacterium]